MALALNVFQTVTANVTTANTVFYTAPTSYTGIVLMAQVTNVTSNPANVTLMYGNGSANTELLLNFAIPGNDAASALTGKLVVETGHTLAISASANNTLKITASILETANE
jgi:hypothetical protein